MDTIIDQQVAIDEALVPHARRLRIAIATVHHHFIRFKMENKKHIVNLESFIEMLHTCPRLPGQSFVEPPFEEEILAFLRFLGHSRAIRRLTDIPHKLKVNQRILLVVLDLNQRRNVEFAYLMWEDFVYQVEHKDTKKSNEMYYPRFTKVIIHHFMSKDPSIPRRNKVAMTKAQQLKLATKRSLQQTHISQASGSGTDEETGTIPRVPDVSTDEFKEEISWNFTDEEGDDDNDDEGDDGDDGEEGNNDDDAQDDDDQEDEGNDEDDQEEGTDDEQASNKEEFIHLRLSTHAEEETRDEESFDPIPKTPENSNDEGNGEENIGMNVGREEGQDEEDEEDELYKDININLGRGIQMGDVHTTQEFEDSHGTLTPVNPDDSKLSGPLPVSAPTLISSTVATITTTQQAPTPPTIAPSTLLQDLPNFGSLFGFDHRLKTLEANFSEFMQTNQFAGAVSSILGITIDENMQKIIKEQVKEQVKVQVSKILPKIEQTVNEQLEAEVLSRSSNSSKTSYAVAADLSEMELKNILIEKMEGNKSIHQSNKQRNLYKPLVKAYESDKIILDTYKDTVTLKRRRDDDEPESASAPKEKATRSAGKLTQGFKYRQNSASESATAEEPMQATFEMEEPSHPEFETGADDQPIVEPSQHPECIQPWISDLAKLSDSRSSFNELMDTPMDFFAFLINRLKVDTLTPKLLAGPTYELMKGSCKSLFYGFAVNRESARDVYSKRRIIVVTELKIVEWHNYKHLDWITVRKDDDKLYKFKEGDFKRLYILDIEDMLVLLVQGKLTNLTVEERFDFNVSL
nr:hypothetical protein [Tanacetum cinerariifolium]